MKRLIGFLRRIISGFRRFFDWVAEQIRWVSCQVSRLIRGLLGPAYRWFLRGLKAVKEKIERVIDWLLSIIRRIFQPAGPRQKVREARVGANGAPLLATLTLAFLWYLLPTARWIGYGPLRFVAVGLLLWVLALIGWLSRCREDRDGRIARFAQRICRSTGLRRLDQWTLPLAALLGYLTWREIQLFPLALGSLIAVLALLTVEYEPRAEFAAPSAPPFPTVDDASVVSLSGRLAERELTWAVTAHGRPRQHHARVTIDEDALEAARARNPVSGSERGIVDWVVTGAGREVEDLARQIHDQCFAGGYSLFATVSCFVGASQAVEYVYDIDSKGVDDYWRYPIETLADGIGDCEDSAILLAALLRRAGFRSAIVMAPGHAAVAVEVPHDTPGSYFERDGVRYYYCETTDDGWMVGEVPTGVELENATFVPVPPWESE